MSSLLSIFADELLSSDIVPVVGFQKVQMIVRSSWRSSPQRNGRDSLLERYGTSFGIHLAVAASAMIPNDIIS